MCLILSAGRGTDKQSDFFINAIRTGAITNKSGFGLAVKKSNMTLFFKKGFSTVDSLLAYIKNLYIADDDELVVHLRRVNNEFGTTKNAQPFECNTLSEESIDQLDNIFSRNPLLFHNGYFDEFSNSTANYHNDTYNFVNNFFKFKDINGQLKSNKKDFLNLFGDVIKTNKLAVMYPFSSIETVFVGDFKSENGYMFSNNSYKSGDIINNGLLTSEISNYNKRIQKRIQRRNKATVNVYSDNFDQDLFNLDVDYKIKLTEENYKELQFKSNCFMPVFGINKNDICYLENYKANDIVHEVRKVESEDLKWLKSSTITSCFDIEPNKDYVNKYRDIDFLNSKIKPTRSSIKKILSKYNKLVCKKKEYDYTCSMKYGNIILKNIRLDAIKEFIEINKSVLNSSVYI